MRTLASDVADDYAACLGLAWLSRHGCSPMLQLLPSFGALRLWRATVDQLVDWEVAAAVARRFDLRRSQFSLQGALRMMWACDAEFMHFGGALYPVELGHLRYPPAGLFWRGSSDAVQQLLTSARVTVVGTRKPTAYGARAVDLMATAFAERGVAVLSGLALGIDGRAHRASLSRGCLTAAVLGSGIDIAYPASHNALHDKIVAQGVVLSELPPGTQPARWTFPHRNRLLAALGDAVLVIEGSPRSGAMQTASAALDLGRPVFAVPGPITSESHLGCNRLIRDGAVPAIEPLLAVEDYLYETRMDRGHRSPMVRRLVSEPDSSPVGESALWGSVLATLEGGATSADRVAAHVGTGVREIIVALSEMEIKGLVVRAGPGLYIRAP